MPAVDDALARLAAVSIELPSWAFGNSGTRFKVFPAPGTARTVREKIADAAQVHRFTGAAPTVALHIPWDRVDDYDELAKLRGRPRRAARHDQLEHVPGRRLQARARVATRTRGSGARPIDHLLECVDIMDATGSRDLKLWFADGTNYPGQDDIRHARTRSPRRSPTSTRGWATTSGCSWSTSSSSRPSTRRTSRTGARRTRTASRSGDARRSASTPGTTRRAPTSSSSWRTLLREGRLGAFDFNCRFYADDDLMVGAADPFQLFRIMYEVVRGGGLDPTRGVAFMLDQCHNIEPKIPGQIRSVMNVQEATREGAARRPRRAGRRAGRRRRARRQRRVMDAFNTDVRPLLAELREELGLHADPMAALRASGYFEQIVAERVGGAQAGWGAERARRPGRRTRRCSSAATGSARPAQHQLRRRQRLGQGHDDRPRHR